MKAIVPTPPQGPPPQRYADLLPDHRHLPASEDDPGLPFHASHVPDHTLLPDKDGTFVRNSYEPLQSHLLSTTLRPMLRRLDPQENFFIGEDCGIYWRLTDPPERGVKAPDWFVVRGVPALLNGQMRRSYVLWQEGVIPTLVLEYVSGDGAEERDVTPYEGKLWVYERALRVPFYGIYDVNRGRLELLSTLANEFRPMEPNARGRFAVPSLNIELGVWQGKYEGFDLPWLRWWDAQGNMLQTGEEEAQAERQRNSRLAEKLRTLGADPDQ